MYPWVLTRTCPSKPMRSFPGFGFGFFGFFNPQSPFARGSDLRGATTVQDTVPCSTGSRPPTTFRASTKDSPHGTPGAFPQHLFNSLQEKKLQLQVCFKEFQRNRNNKRTKAQPGSKITLMASLPPAALARGWTHTSTRGVPSTRVCTGLRQTPSGVRPMQTSARAEVGAFSLSLGRHSGQAEQPWQGAGCPCGCAGGSRCLPKRPPPRTQAGTHVTVPHGAPAPCQLVRPSSSLFSSSRFRQWLAPVTGDYPDRYFRCFSFSFHSSCYLNSSAI